MTPEQARAFVAAHPSRPRALDDALPVPAEELVDLPPADVVYPPARIHPADVLVGIALGLVLGAITLTLWSTI